MSVMPVGSLLRGGNELRFTAKPVRYNPHGDDVVSMWPVIALPGSDSARQLTRPTGRGRFVCSRRRSAAPSTGRAAGVRRVRRAALALTALLLLAGCGGRAGGGEARRLAISTGAEGGVYFVLGAGVARLVDEHMDGYRATAEASTGSLENLNRVASGHSDIAMSLADAASDAVRGTGSFERQLPLQALARLYTNYTQVVADAGAGVRTIPDLKGKRVSTGAANSGTEVIARRTLEAAGLNPDTDIRRERLGIADSAEALEAGKLDAFFWSGGLPTSAVSELADSRRLVLLPTDEYVQPLQQRYGQVYSVATIRAGTYKGVEQDIPTISVENFVVVNRSMAPELAERLTRFLFAHKRELVEVHPEARNIDTAHAQEVAPLELHPGAQRYYQEAR
jgi:TRAP transporter TAXI family solute receptor